MHDQANFRLDGQVALITGAGAGIGRAIAETFAAAGAAVMVSDRNAQSAEMVVEGIVAQGARAVAMACDVTKEDELVQLVSETDGASTSSPFLSAMQAAAVPSPSTCQWKISGAPMS